MRWTYRAPAHPMEPKAGARTMTTVEADEGVGATARVAPRGILFDTAETAVTPESAGDDGPGRAGNRRVAPVAPN